MENDYKELTKLIKQIDKNIRKYEERNKTLPKGTIFVRKINKKYYVYRNRKINGKVISKYLGVYGDPKVDEEIKKSKLYKNGVLNIRRLKKQLDDICKQTNNKQKSISDTINFAIQMNRVDSIEPSEKALELLKLLDRGIIDLETYQLIIDRMYSNAQ